MTSGETKVPAGDGPSAAMTERWESGSDLDHTSEAGTVQLPWEGQPVTLWGSGRDAIRGIFEWGRERHGWRRLLMPSYFCQDVVGSTQRSAPVEVYPWAPTDDEAPPVTTAPGDAVFVSAMFGQAPAVDVRGPAHVIEDHSHDLLAPSARTSQADYVIVSLRKTLPLPDGGAAWSPRGHDLPPEPEVTDAHASSAMERLSGMILKRMYLDGAAIEKEQFREVLVRGERLMAGGDIAGISAFSRIRLGSLPTSRWRRQRAANRSAFFTALGDLHGIEMLDAPFAAILIFADSEQRERVRRSLIAARIYPSVLWPLERPVVSGIPAAHVELSRRMLSIHCDQRYTGADMERVAAAVRGAVNS